MPSTHAEELARLRAEAEQQREGMREFARTAFVFYSACRDAGFSRRDALGLTQTWLVTLIQTAPASGVAETFNQWLQGLGEDE